MSAYTITRIPVPRPYSVILKEFQENYSGTLVPGSIYVDTIDLNFVNNIETFVEQIVSANRVMLDSLGHTHLELIAELAQSSNPNEMIFICLLNQPKK